MHINLASIANSLTECLFEISQLAQVLEDLFEKEGAALLRRLAKAS